MTSPIVSIIIPTFNRAHLIGETLDSVLAQTYENWECIIVDDGSTDHTDEVVGHYVEMDSRFRYYHSLSDQPKGANTCRNYGFELSKGEYVNWFDSDDVMMADFISERIHCFNNKTHFVIGSGYYWDAMTDKKDLIELNLKSTLYKDYLLWKLRILTPSVLFRKSFLSGKALFNPAIKRGQETELFSRLFYKRTPSDYVLVNKPLFLYRQHGDTITNKNYNYIHEFKESQSFIAIENFKKSIEIEDTELINTYYPQLIEFFFRGIDNKHFNNSNYILKNLTAILSKRNKEVTMKLLVFGYLFLTIKRGSYRIEKILKSSKI